MAKADIRKAAFILSTLPEGEAAGLLSQLEPAEARSVIAEMARRDPVGPDERRSAIREFTAASLGRATVLELAAAAPFQDLADVDSETLSVFLAEEHPQTIALVLAHLPAMLGGETLSSLPVELQAAVVRRIAAMGPLEPAVVADVAYVLRRRTAGLATASKSTPGGTRRAAALLRVADRATGQSVLTNLAQLDPAMAGAIRRSAFLFEDLARLPRRDVERLDHDLSIEQWAAALAGADAKLTNSLLDNLPGRTRRRVRAMLDHRQGRTMPSAASIAAARQEILTVAARLDLLSAVSLAAAG